jgi:hypothetical protein
LLVVRHLIEDIHIRVDGLRWLAPASIENCDCRSDLCIPRRLWSAIASLSVSIASRVSSRAAAFTSATTLRASIVSSLSGRPSGLPDCPGLKLVDRKPPFGIAWFYLFVGLLTYRSRRSKMFQWFGGSLPAFRSSRRSDGGKSCSEEPWYGSRSLIPVVVLSSVVTSIASSRRRCRDERQCGAQRALVEAGHV